MPYKNPIPQLDNETKNIINESESDYTPMNEVYFAFIDVLGFKKTFDNIKISKEENVAQKYQNVFNYYFSLMNVAKFMERGKSTGCYAGQTSDSLYFYTERTDYLLQFLKIFSHFNLYAMSQDVFFRGGIAKGKLYKKEKYQFYGDCVIGAYLLESNISKNPIVIIDEKTHSDMSGISEYDKLICTDKGRHYIKPFEYLHKRWNLDIEENFILNKIDNGQIKANIQENKNAFEYDANTYSKYMFLLEEFKNSEDRLVNEATKEVTNDAK